MQELQYSIFTLVLCGALFICLGTAHAKCDPGELVIKFGHAGPETGHPKGETAIRLAKRLNVEMNGTACMQVFVDPQLYDDEKVLEAIVNGDVHLAAPSLSKLEKYTKKLQVFDLPFIFESTASVEKFQASEAGQQLLLSMESKGFVGLGYLHGGMKHLSANKPLLVPDDAEGLTFLVQTSELNSEMIEALGARGQKLPPKEVYDALQNGVVNGQENTWSNIYTNKFFKVQDGATETNHAVLEYLLIVSSEWYEGLHVDVRNQFKQIIDEVLAERNKLSVENSKAYKQKIIDAGGKVRKLTAEQRQLWVDRMQPVWEKYEKNIGADIINAARDSNS